MQNYIFKLQLLVTKWNSFRNGNEEGILAFSKMHIQQMYFGLCVCYLCVVHILCIFT